MELQISLPLLAAQFSPLKSLKPLTKPSRVTRVQVYRFPYCYQNSQWTNVPFSREDYHLEELRVVTMNVWFDEYKWEVRQDSVVALLKEREPHFVCFQEVEFSFEMNARRVSNIAHLLSR